VRYRLMATYRGSPFEAGVGPTDGDIVLFAACPPPEEMGFEPATGHWRKQLPIRDVQAVWESRPVAMFRGARCMVLDDLGDRLHIGYLGHSGYQAEQLGYWQVDRGVYELVAARTEVTDIIEERTEYPRRPETAGPDAYPASQPAQAEYSPTATADFPGYPPAESSGYLSSTPAGSSPGYLPSGPIGYRSGPASGGYSWSADQGAQAATDETPEVAPSSRAYAQPAGTSGAYLQPAGTSGAYPQPAPGYQPGQSEASGVTLPPAAEAPLPLEAAALRAASESRRPRPTAAQRRAAAADAAGATAVTTTGDQGPGTDLPSGPHAVPLPAMAGAPSVAASAGAGPAAAMPAAAPVATPTSASVPAGHTAPARSADPAPAMAAGVAAAAGTRAPASAPAASGLTGPARTRDPRMQARQSAASPLLAPTVTPAEPATAAPPRSVPAPERASTAPLASPSAAPPAAEPARQPSAPPASRSTAHPARQPADRPASQPGAQSATHPASQPGAGAHPTARPASQPTAAQAEHGAAAAAAASTSGPRRSARRRLATERLFAELASLAAIPVDSYAVGEEVEGALCLLETEQGFEVFHSSEGNRHELQFFTSEESACFYLFGVLAAEAVRNGSLLPRAGHLPFARTTQ
jgi:hypothetical protein